MSNYSRVEVNLVPPELLPPSNLRIALLVNILLIIGALSYMGLAAALKLYPINDTKESIVQSERLLATKADIADTHAQLVGMRETVDRYGRVVALASVDYVEIPVLMDRLARVIPDGVYLSSISNEKPSPGSNSTIVQVELVAAQEDPALVQRTLAAFKADPIFNDCFMSNADLRQETFDPNLPAFGVNWGVRGPTLPDNIMAGKYEFRIRANIRKPIDAAYLPIKTDHSMYLADVKFLTPAPEEDPKDKRKKAKAEPASNAPEGVEVAEVR